MKNSLALGFLAFSLVAGFTAQSAFADEAETAAKNARRAEHQEYKAERDAAHGNVAGAERHEADAHRDAAKSRHEEHKAIRKGEY